MSSAFNPNQYGSFRAYVPPSSKPQTPKAQPPSELWHVVQAGRRITSKPVKYQDALLMWAALTVVKAPLSFELILAEVR